MALSAALKRRGGTVDTAHLMCVCAGALLRDGRVLAERVSPGPGVISSLFGAGWVQSDDQTPSIRPVEGRGAIGRLVGEGIPPPGRGLGGRVLCFQRFFPHALRSQPPLAGSVSVFLSDTQSPPGSAPPLWGEDLYATMIGEPGLVHRLLELLTAAIIAFTNIQKASVAERRGRRLPSQDDRLSTRGRGALRWASTIPRAIPATAWKPSGGARRDCGEPSCGCIREFPGLTSGNEANAPPNSGATERRRSGP